MNEMGSAGYGSPARRALLDAFEVAGIPAAIWDVRTHRGRLTTAARALFCQPPTRGEWSREEWLAAVHEDDRSKADLHARSALAGHHPYANRYRVACGTRGLRHLAVDGNYVVDHAGAPRWLVSLPRDVSADHAREESLQNALGAMAAKLEDLEAIYDQAPIGLASLDRDLRFTRINEALAALNGKTVAEHLGQPLFAVLPVLQPVLQPLLARVLAGETVTGIKIDGRSLDPQRPVVCEAHYAPVIAADGSVSGVNIVCADISERHRIEETSALIARELDHRIKNLFAVVSSLAGMTAREVSTVDEFRSVYLERLEALGYAHALMREDPDQQVTSCHKLIGAVLAPYADSLWTRRGDDIALGPRSTSALALCLHEFATNAAKYGCFQNGRSGSLEICTTRRGEHFAIDWQEATQRPLNATRGEAGFGSLLVQRTVQRQLRGALDTQWEQGGLRIRLTLPLETLAM